ncbi:hypothetical protein [Lacrimispora sp.]|uniref:hypothetical protein n=1 Tax=Lacrimispora sp. TaxID=2719234 RepID=UPI0028AB9DF8|nr:hypothetical protein [Lacrimispora sp.]
MTYLEYRLIKETIKKEVIQEMTEQPKLETLTSESKRKQQDIFDKHFPKLRQSDTGRYWRIIA